MISSPQNPRQQLLPSQVAGKWDTEGQSKGSSANRAILIVLSRDLSGFNLSFATRLPPFKLHLSPYRVPTRLASQRN